MPRSLTAVRFDIGRNPENNHADHPDLSQCPTIKASGVRWMYYVDRVGVGWLYDKKCGHNECEEEHDCPDPSPWDVQRAVLLLPEQVADEAMACFSGDPYRAKRLTPAEFETYYDERCACMAPAEHANPNVLARIQAKALAGIELSEADRAALDPESTEPGINKNARKCWKTFGKEVGIELIP